MSQSADAGNRVRSVLPEIFREPYHYGVFCTSALTDERATGYGEVVSEARFRRGQREV